jgi:hypothetical protein
LIRVIMEADALANLGIIWLLGDYHKWFDIIRREVVQAKLDAMGAPPAVARLIQSIYTNQVCRQSTAYGLSAGRVRGQAGFAQGLPGSTTWSLLAQDPLWVLVSDEMRGPGRAATAYGIRAPPRGWSDDYILALANDAATRPLLDTFGATCVDLGISCKPEALRLFLRRSLKEGEPPPP